MKTIRNIMMMSIAAFAMQSCGPDVDDPPIVPVPKTDKAITLNFTSDFNGRTINYSDSTFVNTSGDTFTPLSFKLLFSNIRLVKIDNSEITVPNTFGYVNFAEKKTNVTLPAIAAGDYIGIKFYLGMDSAINFGDPSLYAFDHPLNPTVNGMHWSWQGGYIFVSHEGNFMDNGVQSQYTYHIATIPFSIQIAADLQKTLIHTQDKVGEIKVRCDLSKYFDGANAFDIKVDGSSSHSNPAQAALINKLRTNVEKMFSATAI